MDTELLIKKIEYLKSLELEKREQCKRNGLSKIMARVGAYNKVIELIKELENDGQRNQ